MKRRLLVSYLSITAFVLLVLEIPLGVSYANSVERRLTSDLQHDAFSLAIRAQEPLDPATHPGRAVEGSAALADRYHADAGGRVVIVDGEGRSVADSDPTSPTGRDFSTRPEIQPRPRRCGGERHTVVPYPRRGPALRRAADRLGRPASRARCASRTRPR